MSKLSIVSVSSKEFSDVCDLINKSHPDECVISIHKIENEQFETAFEECRKMLTEKRGVAPTQMRAFHGCSTESATNIAHNGFLKSQNKVSAYGIGTYFGGFYNVSRSYSMTKKQDKYIYHALIIADILLGKMGRSASGNNIDLTNMDVSVDNFTSPSIISLPIDDAAIPRYYVQFYYQAEQRRY
jgi:hypothetical protein